MIDSVLDMFSGGQSRGFGDLMRQIREGMEEAKHYTGRANQTLQPLADLSIGNLRDYINQFNKMNDSGGFINNILNGYKESPWAKTMTNRGIDAAEAAAGRSGTLGSTGFHRQVSDYAADTSSKDMQQWLQNNLGVHDRRMGYQGNVIGQTTPAIYNQASNYSSLAQMLPQLYSQMGQAQAGQRMAESDGWSNLLRGGLGLLKSPLNILPARGYG